MSSEPSPAAALSRAPGSGPGTPAQPWAETAQAGVLMMAAAMLVIPATDALAKLATATVPPGQVAWGRFLFQSLMLAPFVLFSGRLRFGPELLAHGARGALIAGATTFFFTALTVLPLADAIAIFFVEPLILTVLSAVILREGIGWRRLGSVLVGLAGAMIVIQPSFAEVGWVAALPMAAAVCFAFYLILTRRMAVRGNAFVMQFWAGIFGLVFMSALFAGGGAGGIEMLTPVWPGPMEWLMLAGIGVIGTGAHLLVVFAFKRAEASVLAPLQYVEIVAATTLGLFVFGEFPAGLVWLGIGLIIGSGVYVFHRERVRGRPATPGARTGSAR